MSHCPVPAAIFRAYDIRGLVGQDLTEDTVFKIGCAIGSEACRRKIRCIVVGRDGRTSSPSLLRALAQGLQSTGMDVVDVVSFSWTGGEPLVNYQLHDKGTPELLTLWVVHIFLPLQPWMSWLETLLAG